MQRSLIATFAGLGAVLLTMLAPGPTVASEPAARMVAARTAAAATAGVAAAPVPDRVTPADRALAGRSLRKPLTRERFYFAMADRFENGDPGNDTAGIPGDRLAHGYDPTDKAFFHGGDIAGMTQRLDYIEDLGTTAIWLTPSFKNRPVQGVGLGASAGYHGYWVTDFTQIDPHFGTNAELKALIDQAHARGMKVFFDIIVNHTADVISYEEGEYTYISKAVEAYRDASGTEFDDRDYVGTEDFPELDPEVSFPYTPAFASPADATVKRPRWLNDPIYYHNRGDSTFSGEDSTYGDFFGLDDLFTEHPDVVDGMTRIYKRWVDFGIDGFRIDTVKHVNMELWQEFAPAIRQRARRIGNPDFFAFGEVFDSSPAYLSSFTTTGRLDATLDFGFQGAGTGFAKGAATSGLREFFAADDYYTDADSNVYSTPTFLGNHDMGRIGKFIRDGGYAEDEVLERDRLAHDLMYLTRGQPVIYYGDEQGFTGDGGDQDARQDMFPSQVASYNDDDLIGTDATTAEPNFDQEHPLYRHISALAALREAHPALADGAQIHRFASREPGVYAFSRIEAGRNREYVVAVNNATTEQSVSFATFRPHTSFRSIWPAAGQRLWADEEARVTLTVPALSAVVYRAQTRLGRQAAAPRVTLTTPTAGDVVSGRTEVRASVLQGGFNQVTFAYRPQGTRAWTKLGTDDNAPYRVFHDVGAIDDGTALEYRVVLRDHSGNLSAASSSAVVGSPRGEEVVGGPLVQPNAVSAPGSLNTEMGCPDPPGDWQPACDQAQLTLDPNDGVWKKTDVALPATPAGSPHQYKAAINRAWDENYGVGGLRNGNNIELSLPAETEVDFYYDHRTHWMTTDAQHTIVTAYGDFQSELGCSADADPACMRAWLQDRNSDGIFAVAVPGVPAGDYSVRAAHGLTDEESYGAGGDPDGEAIPFSVPTDGLEVVFTYDIETHVLTVTTRAPDPTPDLTQSEALLLRPRLVAWDVEGPANEGTAATRTYRLHWSPTGELEVDDETIGGLSIPLRFARGGLPEPVREAYPDLADHEAFWLRPGDRRLVSQILSSQAGVASYTDLGRLYDATGLSAESCGGCP